MTPKEQQIVDRIKLMLGGDVVKIEIPDSTIYQTIGMALDVLGPYIPDTAYATIPFKKCTDLSTYNCEEVLRVFPGSPLVSPYGIGEEYQFGFNQNIIGGSTLAAWSSNDSYRLRAVICTTAQAMMPDVNIPFDYDRTTHKLYIHNGITKDAVTIEYIPTVTCIDNLQDSASVKWVYLYALALCKEIVGRIRSKAKSSSVPIQLDGDTLLAEASREKEKLEAQLTQEAIGPVGILR